MSNQSLNFYRDFASWWPLFSAPEDYEEEAGIYLPLLLEACSHEPKTLLELGSGGGNNALYMKEKLEVTLSDISPGMLEVSRRLNPECEHVEGDMRTLRLDRTFDLVFVHDAICHMTTEDDIRQVIETASLHCAPGGAALFAPDYLRETFREEVEEGGHDGDDGRALRYLSWHFDPDPTDSTYHVEYAFMLRSPDGTVVQLHDRNDEGLFARATWLGLMDRAGFSARAVPLEHSEVETGAHEMFVARKPA